LVELAGGEHELLTRVPATTWVLSPVRSFGRQRLWEIDVARSGVSKTIRATLEHRWFIQYRNGTKARERTTAQLKTGDRLQSLYPRSQCRTVSSFGVAHGFVFGDGTRTQFSGCSAQFCGAKDESLLPYFPESKIYVGDDVKRISGLPLFFKDPPPMTEAVQYLMGWLAGYFAADGCVDTNGSAGMSSCHPENLEAFRDIAMVAGIGTYSIRRHLRRGLKPPNGALSRDSALYQMTLKSDSLFSDFFVLPHHRARFEAGLVREHSKVRSSRYVWKVMAVRESDEDEVYCATVPRGHAFTLDGNILTGNCHAGCSIEAILDALNLPLSALFTDEPVRQ
jgi:DNA primase